MKQIKRKLTAVSLGIFLSCLLLFSFSKIHFIDLKADTKIKTQALYVRVKPKILVYLDSYKGRYLWSVKLKKIAKKVESIYLGGEVQVQRKFPNRLMVFLKEKADFLLLLKQDHFFYSVSQDGRIGSKKNRQESLNFPILRGKAFEENFKLRQKVIEILLRLSKTEDFFSKENISEILYKDDSKSLLFYLVSDYFIVELKTSPSLKKIKNIEFVLNYLRNQGRIKALIDARLDKKILVKEIK